MEKDQCNCCGTKKGNMLSDATNYADEAYYRERYKVVTMPADKLYGFLCSKCWKIKEASQESERLRLMAAYIERTRNNNVTCKVCSKPIQQTGSPRKRVYCSGACKQRDYRSRHISVTET